MRPLPPQLRRLAAICLPLTLLASPLHAESQTLPPGQSPEELKRLAQRLGYSAEQLRAAGQSPEALDALLKNAPPAAAPFDSSALAPKVPKPETRGSDAAPPPPDDSQPFGYDVFRYSPTTFEPLAYGPVDPYRQSFRVAGGRVVIPSADIARRVTGAWARRGASPVATSASHRRP